MDINFELPVKVLSFKDGDVLYNVAIDENDTLIFFFYFSNHINEFVIVFYVEWLDKNNINNVRDLIPYFGIYNLEFRFSSASSEKVFKFLKNNNLKYY